MKVHKLALILAVLIPAVARSQASPQAEALFRDGKRLLKDGKVAEACAAFEGSERAEHNVATVLSLADCREKNLQYASAWASFLQAESQTRGDPSKAQLNTTARTRARALEARLSYLTINVPDESRIPELIVTRDSAQVDPAEWNRAIPADGGRHVIAGKAPGHEPWSTTVTLGAESDRQAVEVPKFKALRQLIDRPLQPRPEPQPPVAPPSLLTPRRKLGLGIAGGGVAVAGVATYLGLSSRRLRNEAVASCPPLGCTADDAALAQSKNDRARTRALYANLGFGVAGAAAVTGVVLWFLGEPERPIAVAPLVGSSNGLAVVGRF